MSLLRVTLTVNGRPYALEIEPGRTLLDVLRNDLGLNGTKSNCQEGECGACTVMVDGRAVNSCLYLAVRATGKSITTIEGLATENQLHPLQEAFILHGGAQCGYCTPGYIVAAAALLNENPNPTDEELNQALNGNICRCTGYVKIRESIRAVVEEGKRQA